MPPILLAVVLAVAALVFGFLGYWSGEGTTYSVTDALYRTLQLFAIGGEFPDPPPWPVDVARFLAPLAVAYAAVITIVTVLRDHVERAMVAVGARDHIVVVGLSYAGTTVACGLRASGWSVVAVESDRLNPTVATVRAARVRVVVGDPTAATTLEAARVGRARHVVVLTGDDSRNLDVAAAVHRAVGRSRATRPLHLHVGVDDAALWRELDALQLTHAHGGLSSEYINLADRTAIRMLNHAEEIARADHLTGVLVDADTQLAARIVVHVAQRAVLAGVRARIDVASEAMRARILADEPWLTSHADLSVISPPAPDAADPPIALVGVAHDDAAALSRALRLLRTHPNAEVVVSLDREDSEAVLPTTGANLANLHCLAAGVEALTRELLEQSAIEVMARARHDYYVASERAAGRTPADNPSLVEWGALPHSLKESNRRFAESVVGTINGLGGRIVLLQGPPPDSWDIDTDALEALARREHDRWMQSLLEDGWQPTEGRKDPQRKLHPLLVEWDALADSERQKDRDSILAVPMMLARAGYAVELPAGPRG